MKKNTVSLLVSLLVRYKKLFIPGLICLFITNGLNLVVPGLLESAIDKIQQDKDGLKDVLFQIFVLAILLSGTRILSRMFIFFGGRNVEYDLRSRLLDHLLKVEAEFFRTNSVGDTMSRFTNDLGQVRLLLGPGILNLFNSLVIFTGAIVLMGKQNTELLLWAMIPYFPVVLVARGVSFKIYRRNLAVQKYLGQLSDFIQQVLSGLFVVHTFGKESGFYKRFENMSETFMGKTLDLARVRVSFFPFMMSLSGIGLSLILWRGGMMVASGEMTLGAYVKFTSYYALVAWPTLAFGWMLSLWQRGLSSLSRIEDFFSLKVEDEGEETYDIASGPPKIEIINYENDKGLGPVSGLIEPGKTIVIVGPTGCGKTILVESLLRFNALKAGEIQIDNRNIDHYNLNNLRSIFAFVPQDAFLFSRSIAANIGFAYDDFEKRDYENASRLANLHPDIGDFPDGYETVVGERGVTLSGGQRQRLCLARALLSDSPVLILDDCLSALDVETERKILLGLKSELSRSDSKRSALIISQRLSMVDLADEIWVMDEGKIIDSGKHKELFARCELYKSLYELQSLKNSKSETQIEVA